MTACCIVHSLVGEGWKALFSRLRELEFKGGAFCAEEGKRNEDIDAKEAGGLSPMPAGG
jgi:hypothetical protein